MPPQRSYLVLSTHVPDIELNILVCDGLDIKANGRDGGDVLVQLELVQDRYIVVLALCFHLKAI